MKAALSCIALLLLAGCKPDTAAPAATVPAPTDTGAVATAVPDGQADAPMAATAPPSFDCATAASEAEHRVQEREQAAQHREAAALEVQHRAELATHEAQAARQRAEQAQEEAEQAVNQANYRARNAIGAAERIKRRIEGKQRILGRDLG